MARHVLAFDLDGTLVKHVGDVLFDNPSSLAQGCIVDRDAKIRIVELLDQGHEVHVVTARSHKVRLVTKAHVAQIDARLKLHLETPWEGYDVGKTRKAAKLVELGAEAYVGDHLMDELAAETAGIPFMDAKAFRSGKDLLVLVGEQPVPKRKAAKGGR